MASVALNEIQPHGIAFKKAGIWVWILLSVPQSQYSNGQNGAKRRPVSGFAESEVKDPDLLSAISFCMACGETDLADFSPLESAFSG